MGFPVDYLRDINVGDDSFTPEDRVFANQVRAFLDEHGLVATRVCDPFGGQIARVQIHAYGESAAEVESSLLEFGSRCSAASQVGEVSFGGCVIERNLDEEWGATYSWQGRLTLHPSIGSMPNSERAAAAIRDA